MTDPYAPPDPDAATAEPDLVSQGEVRSPLEQFVARLRDLGAQPDEVQTVVDHWDDLDPDNDPDPEAWTRARRAQLAAMGDAELSGLLAQSRAEYTDGTTTQEDADEAAHTAALEQAIAEAQGRIGANVQSVLAWVADDPVRAEAVVRLEVAPEGANRTTLWGPLADQLGWTGADVEVLAASYTTTPAQVAPGGPEGEPGTQAATDPSEAQGDAQGPESGEPGAPPEA